jgi:5-methylcytosine-specific restriction endonuclease McrA
MKKTPRKALKNKLELLVKAFVKKRDNYTCQHCDKKLEGSNCHASHVIPVSADGRLAYDALNLKVLCYHCHLNWWHKNPTEAGEWYANKFPKRLKYLQDQHQQNQKLGSIPLSFFEDLILYYQNLY